MRYKSLLLLSLGCASGLQAMIWSDNAVSERYGSTFREPFNSQDIAKHIIGFTHASGYKYGTNFANLDLLFSDNKDENATEGYFLYRHLLDMGKVTNTDLSWGPVRGLGINAGFDVNYKNDDGYGSRKRMLVAGPTVMFNVPGFFNVGILAMQESNHPHGVTDRYDYDTKYALDASWGIPFKLGKVPLLFGGYADWISTKGKNEFGGPTGAEFHIDAKLMADVGVLTGLKENTLWAGVDYEYWHNKFGNPSSVDGSCANTPMVRVEYHF